MNIDAEKVLNKLIMDTSIGRIEWTLKENNNSLSIFVFRKKLTPKKFLVIKLTIRRQIEFSDISIEIENINDINIFILFKSYKQEMLLDNLINLVEYKYNF